MKHVTAEMIEQAESMRAAGASWGTISRALGFDSDVIRRRIDPVFIAKEALKRGGPPSMLRMSPWRPTEDDFRRIQTEVPSDSRSWFSRAMGDPLPGRSALDKQRADEAARSADAFSPVRAERTYYLRGFLG